MQINRLFEIVYLLLDRQSMTAKELACHFEVSPRTIYRDIEALSQAGIPVYMAKGKGGGIRLLPEFVLNKVVLSPQERQEVLAALQGMVAVSPLRQQGALAKLDPLFGGERQDWLEIDFADWDTAVQWEELFQLLRKAVLEHQVVEFAYHNSRGETSRRQVEPLKLVFKGQGWYLYGYCQSRQDFRFFKLTRIRKAQALEQRFFRPRPKRVTLPRQTPWAETLLPVTLKIDACMAFRVYDEFTLEHIQRLETGDFRIEIQLPQGNWLYSFLLSYGPHLEVLDPPALRWKMAETLARMSELYKI